jgi:hypothetical protein
MTKIKEELVLSGTWTYAGCIDKEVHIIKSNIKYGSGDYEDPLEIREDQYGLFYGVRIGPYPNNKSLFGGDYFTIEDAKNYASTVCPSLSWVSEHNVK